MTPKEIDDLISDVTHNEIYSTHAVALKALDNISKIIHSNPNELSDGEVIDYIDSYLQAIGIK